MIIGKAISPFALRKKINGIVPTDPDAQLFITATGITGTNATATNQLVLDLKSANIWTKMKAVYPMVGGTATTHKFNLVNPQDTNAAFRLAFQGGGTHSSNGYLPNGTNAYAKTYLTPSVSLSLNNTHLSNYSRTNSTTFVNLLGSQQLGGTNSLALLASTSIQYRINDYNNGTSLGVNDYGFLIGSRISATQKKLYKNSSLNVTDNVNSLGLPNQSILISAYQDSGVILYYSNRECAFSSIGDGLTDAEALAYYNAVQTFNTTLGRQV